MATATQTLKWALSGRFAQNGAANDQRNAWHTHAIAIRLQSSQSMPFVFTNHVHHVDDGWCE
jgi:hypothetical protein